MPILKNTFKLGSLRFGAWPKRPRPCVDPMRCSLPLIRPATWCAVALWLALPAIAAAAPVTAVSPFASQTFSRTVHGDIRSLDLEVAGRQWGTAGAFFGVESAGGASQRYLTSGVQWRSGALGVPATRVSVLQTETQGTQGGQILAHARTELDLGDAWYLPNLTAEVAQLTGGATGGALLGGGAIRFGLTKRLGASAYDLGYFRSDPHFTALGSSIAAGQRGLVFGASHQLGSGLVLAHHMRLRQAAGAASANIRHDVILSRAPRLNGLGTHWELNARYGRRGGAGPRSQGALSLELAAQTDAWRDWRIDTAIGWYDAALSAPLGLPVAGAMWRLSATRHLSIAGFRTRVAPAFALGGSGYDLGGVGLRTGLTMGFTQLSDHIDFNVNYLSANWSGADAAHGDLRMSVSYRQSTAGILAGLRAFASKLRLPWQRP